MTSREDIQRAVRRRLDAMNGRELAHMGEAYADNCTVHSPSAGGLINGRSAIEAIDLAWATAFPDARFVTEDLLIDGNRAAWVGRVEGTGTGAFFGLPPTGRPFNFPMVLVSTFGEGGVVNERRFYDFTGMLIQLGILRARQTIDVPSQPEASTPSARSNGPVAAREAIVSSLVRRREAWVRRDVDAIAAQHASECVMDSHLAGRVEGPDAIARVYRSWFSAFPDSTLPADGEPVIDANRAAECATMSGTDTGGLLGLPPTGKPFSLPSVWLYTVRDEQFVYVRPIYDFTGLLVQIGLLKPKPA